MVCSLRSQKMWDWLYFLGNFYKYLEVIFGYFMTFPFFPLDASCGATNILYLYILKIKLSETIFKSCSMRPVIMRFNQPHIAKDCASSAAVFFKSAIKNYWNIKTSGMAVDLNLQGAKVKDKKLVLKKNLNITAILKVIIK